MNKLLINRYMNCSPLDAQQKIIIANKIFKIFRIFGVPLISIFVELSFFMINPIDAVIGSYQLYGWGYFILDLFNAIVTGYLISEGIIIIRKLFWEIEYFQNREITGIIVQIAIQKIYSIIILHFAIIIQISIYDMSPYKFLYWQGMVIGGLTCIIAIFVYTGIFLVQKWIAASYESEQLRNLNLQSQFQALKAQLDPHFLFNNLNTLTNIIEEKSPIAVEFVGRLSKVYRYVLEHGSTTLTSVKNELEFIKSYLFLVEARFGKSLVVELNLSAKALNKKLPPMSLQLLIENAMKHNVVSIQKPLFVKIYDEKDMLVVSNNLQKRKTVEPSTKVGLNNITERYRLMEGKLPVIKETDGNYIVKIPLIDTNGDDDEQDV